jgi:Flp pilus assembly secretin CpaC
MNIFENAAFFVTHSDDFPDAVSKRCYLARRGAVVRRNAALRSSVWALSCALAFAAPSFVQPASAQSAPSKNGAATKITTIALPLDKELELPFPPNSTFTIIEGASFVRLSPLSQPDDDGKYWLSVEPLSAGRALIQVETPNVAAKRYAVNISDTAATPARTPAPRPAAQPIATPRATPQAPAATPVPTPLATPRPQATPAMVTPSEVIPVATPVPQPTMESVVPLPALRTSQNSFPSSLPTALAPVMPEANEPQISPVLPQPARLPQGRSAFPALPDTRRANDARATRPRPTNSRTINVTQGLARIMSFRRNILQVFFSDLNVMDARAMNARTVAVTGAGPGRSTLAVFIERFPGDVVGQAEIFNIVVEPPTPRNTLPTAGRDAATIELAIRSALNDPRIQVRVIQQPNGSFAASLSGTVRDQAEIRATVDTAALFVPRDQVISALYTDVFAPSLAQAQNPTAPVTSEQVLQAKLRQITGNSTLDVISLPTGLAVKAEVDSTADAEALLNLLPTLNQRVLPFIVVRGQNTGTGTGAPVTDTNGGRYYGSDRPILTGEDQEITRKLHEVTGVRTVYAVRTAQNAMAVYGTARNRSEYDTVRRYLLLLPLLGPESSSTQQSQTISTGGGSVSAPNAGGGNTGAGSRALISPQMSQNGAQFNSNAQIVSGGATAPGAGGTTAAPGGPSAILPAGPGTGFNNNAVGTADGAGVAGPTGTGAAPFVPGIVGATDFPGQPGFLGAPGFVPNVPGNYSFSQQGAGVPGSYRVSQAEGFTDPESALGNPANAAQQPHGAYRQSVNLQMFVRILDADGQAIRRVTAETSIVEISRNSLKNLGVESGTVAILTQEVTPGTPATRVTGPNGVTESSGTPPVISRTFDPTFRPGLFTAANGIVGGEGFSVLDPLRLRLNALYQNGNVRILSRPNITAVEGASAQITIGGERPVPSAVATGQAVGQTIIFRRFGIILTMRPTITDDDTIILQIRADISELANEFGVTINGALIPGERVRSVDTTMTVRDGDIIVLGGLISNERRQQTSRVPILSSIPILGRLFQSRRFENNETELAIFMTPRIDRTVTTVNTKEAVQRVPALPGLPSNQQSTGVFGLGGNSGAAGGQ